MRSLVRAASSQSGAVAAAIACSTSCRLSLVVVRAFDGAEPSVRLLKLMDSSGPAEPADGRAEAPGQIGVTPDGITGSNGTATGTRVAGGGSASMRGPRSGSI